MSDLISIIIPVYNAEKYVAKCLDSIISQTHLSLEIIIIDDGSTDKSAEICNTYAKKDKRIIVLHQLNSGVSAARNLGLDYAKGDYIGFCDSDDWIESNMYETLLSLLKEHKADVSIISFATELDKQRSSARDSEDVTILNGKEAILQMHIATLFEGQLCNKLFRKDLFSDVRLDTSLKYFEDLLVLWSVFLMSQKVVYRNDPLYHYTINPKSALNQKYRETDWQRRDACLKMQEMAHKYYHEALPYVNKTLLMADIHLAEKMVLSNLFCKEKRLLLQNEVRILHSKQVDDLLTSNRRKKVVLFEKHSILFVWKTKLYYFLHVVHHLGKK